MDLILVNLIWLLSGLSSGWEPVSDRRVINGSGVQFAVIPSCTLIESILAKVFLGKTLLKLEALMFL